MPHNIKAKFNSTTNTVINPPITLSGRVVSGMKEGRTIGFPTANLDIQPDTNQVAPGVYAGKAKIVPDESTNNTLFHPALIYYGPRLIHGQKKLNFEIHLYDFNQDIYGQKLEVVLVFFVRPPMPFVSVKKLIAQINTDSAQVQDLLASLQ